MAGVRSPHRWCGLLLGCATALTSQAGLFNEHKYIGDIAFKRFVENNDLGSFLSNALGYPRYGIGLPIPFRRNWNVYTYYQGMFAIKGLGENVSYGDACGLAGDHSVDFIQLISRVLPADTGFLHGKSFSRYRRLDGDILDALASHHTALDNYKNQGGYWSIAYLLLAAEDKSHFQRPPHSALEMLQAVDPALVQCLHAFASLNNDQPDLEVRARALQSEMDDRFLRLNNSAKYAILHALALNWVFLAAADDCVDGDPVRMSDHLSRAFITNAFADHFLQDAFAAGHLPVKRNFFGLDNNGVHDFYNRVGIVVSNEQGRTWRTFGDNFYDDETFDRAIEADLHSLQELWDKFLYYETTDHDSWTNSLYADMQDGKLCRQHWADTLKHKFSAFAYMPIPLDRTTYRDSIELKRGSKNGFFFEVGNSHFGGDGELPYASLGVGLGLIKPSPHSDLVRRPSSRKFESVLWGGLAVGYAQRAPGYSAEHGNGPEKRFFIGPRFSYKDRLACDFGSGWTMRDGTAYFTGNAAIGLEMKYLWCFVAPSLKYCLEYGVGRKPYHGIQVAFRFY